MFLSLRGVSSISFLTSSENMADILHLSYIVADVTDYVSSYISPGATNGYWKQARAVAGAWTVLDGQHSTVVNADGFHAMQKQVRFQGCRVITESDTTTARGPIKCQACEDENWLQRPRASDTAGAG